MKKMLSKTIAGFAVVMIAACSGGSGEVTSNTPEMAAQKYLEAEYNGDTQAVISMLNGADEAGVKEGGKDFFSALFTNGVQRSAKEAEKNEGIESITANNVEPVSANKKNLVYVKTTVRFKNGTEKVRRVKLIETSEGWKLH